MNSTYGRFGMSPIFERHEIVSASDSEDIINDNKDVDVQPLPSSGNVIVSYSPNDEEDFKLKDLSVAISAAIAAYARIEMSYYLVKYEDYIICCDTDGIKVTFDLDSKEIDDGKLGMMKYEYCFSVMVSPGAKMYGGLLKVPYKGLDEIVKIKGVKKPISYYHLSRILYKDNPVKVVQEI
jgi:hypothetical protein